MKRERAQLSAKNPCRIPKHRYYELKHFCLQYPDWKKALVLLDGWNTEPRDIPGIIKGRPPESPTERQAIARLYYSGQIAIVDRCIDELDPTLAPFILKGVTEGITLTDDEINHPVHPESYMNLELSEDYGEFHYKDGRMLEAGVPDWYLFFYEHRPK